MSERARDLAPYEPTDEELSRIYNENGNLVAFVKGWIQPIPPDQNVTSEMLDECQRHIFDPSWTRTPRQNPPEPWRMTGRPFDPRRRGASEGEQRHHAADSLLWTVSGVLGGLAALWLAWSSVAGLR